MFNKIINLKNNTCLKPMHKDNNLQNATTPFWHRTRQIVYGYRTWPTVLPNSINHVKMPQVWIFTNWTSRSIHDTLNDYNRDSWRISEYMQILDASIIYLQFSTLTHSQIVQFEGIKEIKHLMSKLKPTLICKILRRWSSALMAAVWAGWNVLRKANNDPWKVYLCFKKEKNKRNKSSREWEVKEGSNEMKAFCIVNYCQPPVQNDYGRVQQNNYSHHLTTSTD